MIYFLLIYYICQGWKVIFRRFHLVFTIMIVLYKGQRFNVGITPIISIPITHSGTREMTSGWIQGHTVSQNLARTPFITWPLPPYTSILIGGHDNALGLRILMSTQTLSPAVLKSSGYPSPSVCTAIKANGHRSLWRRTGESYVYLLPPFKSMGFRSEKWLRSGH